MSELRAGEASSRWSGSARPPPPLYCVLNFGLLFWSQILTCVWVSRVNTRAEAGSARTGGVRHCVFWNVISSCWILAEE